MYRSAAERISLCKNGVNLISKKKISNIRNNLLTVPKGYKTTLITGCTSGIGKALSVKFADRVLIALCCWSECYRSYFSVDCIHWYKIITPVIYVSDPACSGSCCGCCFGVASITRSPCESIFLSVAVCVC